MAESMLAAALILLLVGYRTRTATLLVFLCGFGLAVMRHSLLLREHTLMLLVFYVPLFMFFSNWGSTYSIDALLKQRRSQFVPHPHDSSWHYIWPSRGLMVVLSFLFLSSAVIKIKEGDWITNPNYVSNFMLSKGIASYLNNGFPVNPLGLLLARSRFLIVPSQYIVLLFETAFILVLFSGVARAIIFRLVLIFHSCNTFFLGIPFAAVLSVYAAFPDWQQLYERFYPRWLRPTWLAKMPTVLLISSSLFSAALIGVLWDTTPIPRTVFSLFGLINYRTIWFVIFPLAVIWLVTSIYHWLWPQYKYSGDRAD
ncbi:MAG: hypothetical protein ACFB4I_12680 [Cyanophyceae cyanobacterium]